MRPDDKREFVQWLRLMADELEAELKEPAAKAAPTPEPQEGLDKW